MMADKLEGLVGISQTNATEREALRELCADCARVLEIGTADGVTIAWLADEWPATFFVSVDTFPNRDDGVAGVLGNVALWLANRRRNMRLWVGTAQDFVAYAHDDLFDLAIVDGEHTYAACRADLDSAHRLTGPTAKLAVHDYHRPSDNVRRAVDEFCARHDAHIVGRFASMVVLAKSLRPVVLSRMEDLGYVA